MYPLWWTMAWQEIKQRYKRSLIGPFWITLSTGVMVAAMGPLYGSLFGQSVSGYIQYLALSLIIWTFISSCINEAGSVFIGAESYIKQVALPLTVYVFRAIARNLILLGHNALIILLVLVFLPPRSFSTIWLVPLGLILVIANLFLLMLLLGMLSTRFRDIPQVVANIVQAAFFLSPIIWRVEMLGENRYLADLNPLYHLIEVVRAPLLGDSISKTSWLVVVSLLVILGLLTYLFYNRARARVPFWL